MMQMGMEKQSKDGGGIVDRQEKKQVSCCSPGEIGELGEADELL